MFIDYYVYCNNNFSILNIYMYVSGLNKKNFHTNHPVICPRAGLPPKTQEPRLHFY